MNDDTATATDARDQCTRRTRRLVSTVALALVITVVWPLTAVGFYSQRLLTYPRPPGDTAADAARLLRTNGIAATSIETTGPLGAYDGVLVDGDDDTWVLMVHGRGASLLQGAALLDPLTDAGLPVLFTSYRNDGHAPDDPTGLTTLGVREGDDLQAWVDTAQARGADDLILVGHSMGGSVVGSFLRSSSDAASVRGVILDSPMVSLQATLEFQAAERGIPAPLVDPLVGAVTAISEARADVDLTVLEHLEHWSVEVPTLLVHGTADTVVPDAPTVALARRLDHATLLRPPGVDHHGLVDDLPTYHEAVRHLLARIGAVRANR